MLVFDCSNWEKLLTKITVGLRYKLQSQEKDKEKEKG
jgi:hypothetical protein